jgi:hypothetical protein
MLGLSDRNQLRYASDSKESCAPWRYIDRVVYGGIDLTTEVSLIDFCS